MKKLPFLLSNFNIILNKKEYLLVDIYLKISNTYPSCSVMTYEILQFVDEELN